MESPYTMAYKGQKVSFFSLCKHKISSNASDLAIMRKEETKRYKSVLEFQRKVSLKITFCGSYGTLGIPLIV